MRSSRRGGIMSGPQYFHDPVSGTAVPEQAPIDVFADDDEPSYVSSGYIAPKAAL
jgi:hypothetical protein